MLFPLQNIRRQDSTVFPRLLNVDWLIQFSETPTVCKILVYFSATRARSMYEMAFELWLERSGAVQNVLS